MALLSIRDLAVEFAVNRETIHALRGVSMSLEEGSRTAVVGESGSGKTVTALSVLRLLPPTARVTSGQIEFAGRDVTSLDDARLGEIRGSQVAMIFQHASAALNPLWPVGRQIADVYRRHRGGTRRQAWEQAVEVLAATGIPDAAARARDYPHQFSGGMAQRVMIAMALVCSPRLLIADEPTTGLDLTIQVQVLDLIAEVVERLDATLMLISHDLAVVGALCDHVVVMYAGEVMESGTTAHVLETPANPYTEGLLACFAEAGGGDMPSIPRARPGHAPAAAGLRIRRALRACGGRLPPAAGAGGRYSRRAPLAVPLCGRTVAPQTRRLRLRVWPIPAIRFGVCRLPA